MNSSGLIELNKFSSQVFIHYLVVPGSPGLQEDEFAAGQLHLLIMVPRKASFGL